MTATETKVKPFYCGTQAADWDCRNCNLCRKVDLDACVSHCDIYDALTVAAWNDGTMDEALARRMGWYPKSFRHTWDCKERETK